VAISRTASLPHSLGADEADNPTALDEGDQEKAALVEWPTMISRPSRSEWFGSSWIRASESPNAVRASSNETPCFLKFEAAFVGFQVNRVVIDAKHTTHHRPLDSSAGRADSAGMYFSGRCRPLLKSAAGMCSHGFLVCIGAARTTEASHSEKPYRSTIACCFGV